MYNIDRISFSIYQKSNQVVGRWISKTGYERPSTGMMEENYIIEFLQSIANQVTKSDYKAKAQEMLDSKSWIEYNEETPEKKATVRPSRKSKSDLENDIIDISLENEDLTAQLKWLLKTPEQYKLFKEKWETIKHKLDNYKGL